MSRFLEKNKINLIVLLLTLGAMIAIIAPFSHMFFSRDSQVKVFGFDNARKFFYSLGMPVTIFIGALIMSYITSLIKGNPIYKFLRRIPIVFLSVAIYYILWIFSAFSDFDPLYYYIMLITVSITFGILVHKFLTYVSASSIKLLKVQSKIPNLDQRIKTVNDIARIMPDDNDSVATYKSMVDITGDHLQETITEIKKDLN